MSTHNVLTIAGTDPSGGAGIQADLKTFAAHACYGTSVVTALVAQNTTGVKNIFPVAPSFVVEQVSCVLDDIPIHGIKTGMLFDKDVIASVVDVLKQYQQGQGRGDANKSLAPLIVDPVCAATSGHALLQPDALDALVDVLFPLAALITPNKTEAELLLRHRKFLGDEETIQTLDDMLSAAKKLASLTSQGKYSVLLKGGHLTSSLSHVHSFLATHEDIRLVKQGMYDENMEILLVGSGSNLHESLVVDLLYQPFGQTVIFVRPRVDSTSTHGTGCTLAASITCNVARGMNLEQAIGAASLYTHNAIASARKIGSGFGPLEHLHSVRGPYTPKYVAPTKATGSVEGLVSALTVSPRTAVNPYPFTHYLISSTLPAWKGYVEHDFVKQLGKGTLPKEKFVRFITQDYHYLKYYARAYALLAAKSSTFEAIHSATNIILSVIQEIATHKTFCASFGVTAEELEGCEEEVACTAYGAYIINIGLQGDAAKLTMALMACLLGYGEVGLWLKRHAIEDASPPTEEKWVVIDGNPYKKWIEDYSGEWYQGAVKAGLETLENLVVEDPPSPERLRGWKDVWERCTNLEKGFWDMAMNV